MKTWIERIYPLGDYFVLRTNDDGSEVYLHRDGTWHPSTVNGDVNSGLFMTHTEAQIVLARATASLIRLTTANWWQELETLRTTIGMPAALVDCLKSLVSSHLHSTIGPEAAEKLTWLARIYLANGIMLCDSASDLLYDVMVAVPNPGKEEERVSRFKLVPKWPDMKLKYLEDLDFQIETMDLVEGYES